MRDKHSNVVAGIGETRCHSTICIEFMMLFGNQNKKLSLAFLGNLANFVVVVVFPHVMSQSPGRYVTTNTGKISGFDVITDY